jgi:transcriptional regulator with XRE-family HTH domain
MMKSEDRYRLIGQRIREARTKKGWSQKTLAEKLGFESATAISLIEAGERRPSVELLEKIADQLDRDIGFLLGKELDEANLRVALRSQKDLSKEDKQMILHFVELARKREKRGE